LIAVVGAKTTHIERGSPWESAQGHLTGGGRPYTATAVQKMLRGG
jgi:hypothetical protein